MPNPSDTQTGQPVAETVAAIDIGSNSIRMVVAQILPDGQVQVLEMLRRAVRLGQDTFRTGRIRAQTMRSAVAILRDYQSVLATYGAHRIRAVATSAVREAANGETFIDRILMATGLEVSIINVAEEGRLTVSAVRNAVPDKLLARAGALVVEVGGGSTLLNLLRKGQVTLSQSLPTGSVRMQEVLATSSEPADQAARLIKSQIASAISTFKGLLPLKGVQTFVAVGREPRWAAAHVGKPSDSTGLESVRREALDELIETCQSHTADELARTYSLSFTDAETIVPALLVYQALLKATRARAMLVTDVSIRDGLLQELAHSISGREDDSAYHEVIESAQAVALKYRVDMAHAQHMRTLAVRLFDELAPEHHLGQRHRLLLEVAALLHELGTFVSSRAHHKHSYYLIANSEILGLTQAELLVVANVARYHRRGRPKPTHTEYVALPRERRLIVNRLAALLRVADALDVSRTQQISEFRCRIENNGLIISIPGSADLTLENRSLVERANMFQDIYGLDVRLEQSEPS